MKPTADHERPGSRCFAKVQFGKRMVNLYHSSTLMYPNLNGDKDFKRRYEEVVMFVSVEESQTCSVHIKNEFKGSDRRIHHA